MKSQLYTTLYFTLFALTFSTIAMDKPTQVDLNKQAERMAQIRDRGPMLHWASLDEYLNARQGKKTFLVVGCGHGAFSYSDEHKTIIGMHGSDETSKDFRFSHPDAFTITAQDGIFGHALFPDINGYFPNDLPTIAKGVFDEIFFECVNGGTEQYYKAAYDILKPGGALIDDRYGEKNTAMNKLVDVGFVSITFQDFGTNPRNGRESQLVSAQKPVIEHAAVPHELVDIMIEKMPNPWSGWRAKPATLRADLRKFNVSEEQLRQYSDEQIAAANALRVTHLRSRSTRP